MFLLFIQEDHVAIGGAHDFVESSESQNYLSDKNIEYLIKAQTKNAHIFSVKDLRIVSEFYNNKWNNK